MGLHFSADADLTVEGDEVKVVHCVLVLTTRVTNKTAIFCDTIFVKHFIK